MKTLLKSEVFETNLFGSHGAIIPENAALLFLNKGLKRIVVNATLKDKNVSYHSAIHSYQGNYLISYSKQYQKALDAFPSDYVLFQLIEDTSRYGVEMPEEFEAVLESDPEAFNIFESFTKGKQRSLLYYVLGFKNSQTRIDKSLLISENLKRGFTNPKEIIKAQR